MVKINVEISDELKKQIDESNIDVSRVFSESISNELIKVLALRVISSKSKLSEEDSLKLGREIKSGRFNELKSRGLL
mgnify:CR=1 FL=1